ncbi:hypothetical protein [Streptomyces sp. enrichment culture]|uniref:hypothetical protein n=1 Tax=Streptomyces sp. enrichment culture TaxID=1795815 RepID=UPI003F56FF17
MTRPPYAYEGDEGDEGNEWRGPDDRRPAPTARTVQLGGESCPGVLRYFGELPSRMAATPSDADVRDAFGPVIGR